MNQAYAYWQLDMSGDLRSLHPVLRLSVSFLMEIVGRIVERDGSDDRKARHKPACN